MIRHFCFIFLLLLSCFSCSGGNHFLGAKKKSQVVRINFTYSPLSLDPRKCTDPVTTVTSYILYEGLTRLEPDGSISPALAQKIKISKDRKTYRFTLRKSMWSDGSPLTAYHFEAAWKKVLSPDFPSSAAHFLFPIKNGERAKFGKCSIDEIGVEAIDEQTLVVKLTRPTPYFLELTAYPTFFPVPYHGDEILHPNEQTDLLSNGPFLLLSFKNDDEIIVRKNPYYWNAEEVNLEGIHATMIRDEATALKLFEKGKLDYIGGLISPLPLDAVATLRKTNLLKQRPIAGTTFATFNVRAFPFNNVHIRKAFAYAVNRQEMTDNISQMFDDVASGPVPLVLKKESTPLFEDNHKALAKEHFERGLEELGITKEEFPKITYSYFSSELQRNLALVLQSVWSETLGVSVELETNELKTHLAKLHSGKFQMGQMSWIGQYHDPLSFLERFVSKNASRNYGNWESPRYARLIADSFYLENGHRLKLLEEAEQLLVDEMPIIPFYHFHAVYLKSSRLHGLSVSPMGDIQFHKAICK